MDQKDRPAGAGDIVYIVDAEDRIVAVEGDWEGLEESGTPPSGVIGRNILDFVGGHFTRRFLRDFLEAARSSGVPQVRRYRCDTPKMKRTMEMEAIPTAGGLRLVHRLVEEEPFPYEIRIHAAVRASAVRYHRCSICNRLRYRDRQDWMEPELCAPRGSDALVIHTVCPDCRDQIRNREARADLGT